jgi:N-acetylglucosamine-6-phosphate deacetylase
MDELVRLMARLPGMTARQAIEMATVVPARVLGESRLGRINEGACSDLVVVDSDLRVRLTMIRGVVQFKRRS